MAAGPVTPSSPTVSFHFPWLLKVVPASQKLDIASRRVLANFSSVKIECLIESKVLQHESDQSRRPHRH
jgi:hypothetical protein